MTKSVIYSVIGVRIHNTRTCWSASVPSKNGTILKIQNSASPLKNGAGKTKFQYPICLGLLDICSISKYECSIFRLMYVRPPNICSTSKYACHISYSRTWCIFVIQMCVSHSIFEYVFGFQIREFSALPFRLRSSIFRLEMP